MKISVSTIIESIEYVSNQYYRLIILVGSSGTGKSKLLKQICKETDASIINVNQELSRQMLELTERQRMLSVNGILTELVDSAYNKVVLLDNIEILFDVNLKIDPLRLLQGLSRDKTIIAAWSGRGDKDFLYYADYEHPEYKKYPLQDFIVIKSEGED